jgi:hypothetical protein
MKGTWQTTDDGGGGSGPGLTVVIILAAALLGPAIAAAVAELLHVLAIVVGVILDLGSTSLLAFVAFRVSRGRHDTARHGTASHHLRTFQAVNRDENGREHRCHHNHRTPEAAQECAQWENRRADEAARSARMRRVASMSAEEYRREAEADPVYRDWLRRREAEVEAEIQRPKDQA